MRGSFERRVLETIGRYALFERGDTVLVALSGGADSVALLLVLLDLREVLELKLRAAHINHRLRGVESDGDEAFVRDLCARLDVPLTVDFCSDEDAEKGNLEAALRECRYRHLSRHAAPWGARIATGHTLNDQAETVLLNLFRGAGPRGLSGIAPVRRAAEWGDAVLVRPLIESTRLGVLKFLERKGQAFRVDSSNTDSNFDRNWIRNFLIPQVEDRLNSEVIQALGRTARLEREVSLLLDLESSGVLDRCQIEGSDLLVSLAELRAAPPLVGKEVVRRCVSQTGGGRETLAQPHVDAVLELLNKRTGAQISLPGGLRVLREFENLRFTTADRVGFYRKKMEIPGELDVKESGRRIRILPAEAGSEGCLFLHGNMVEVRNWRPGDRFAGSTGRERKLKRFFVEARIPREERARRILVEQQGVIVWAEGWGAAASARRSRTGREKCFRIEVLKL